MMFILIQIRSIFFVSNIIPRWLLALFMLLRRAP